MNLYSMSVIQDNYFSDKINFNVLWEILQEKYPCACVNSQ